MRMILIKTNYKVRDAKDLLHFLQQGFALHRNTDIDSVFRFIGLDGNVYSTDRDRAKVMKLKQTECLYLFENFHEFEVYSIVWLAFDNLAWNENLLLSYRRDGVEIYDNKTMQVSNRDRLIDADFITNLYKTGSKDIWIFSNFQEEAELPIDSLTYITALLDDGTMVTDYHQNLKSHNPNLVSRIRMYQPAIEPKGSQQPQRQFSYDHSW